MKLLNKKTLVYLFTACMCVAALYSCGVYNFRDVSIPADVKTIRITPFINQARYVNPQLSPRLTDAFQQKIARQTRLTRTTDEAAHYQVGGYISQYDFTTAGISGKEAVTNRLTVSVHIVFRNTLTNKSEEYDVSRNFDFAATLSNTQAESQLLGDVIRNMSDEIFNRIFSNW